MSEPSQTLTELHKRRVEESHLYTNFEKHYKDREFVKASEFLWGSISKMVYAIGLLSERRIGKHKEIASLIRELAASEGKPEAIDWTNAAESLHSNFYHNWMEEEIFENYVRKVVDLRSWLMRILDRETERFKQQFAR